MNTNKVPKGKIVYIEGRKFKAGEVLPPWALIDIPEIAEKDVEKHIKESENKKYHKYKKKRKR